MTKRYIVSLTIIDDILTERPHRTEKSFSTEATARAYATNYVEKHPRDYVSVEIIDTDDPDNLIIL